MYHCRNALHNHVWSFTFYKLKSNNVMLLGKLFKTNFSLLFKGINTHGLDCLNIKIKYRISYATEKQLIITFKISPYLLTKRNDQIIRIHQV